MRKVFLNRVWVNTATAGTGAVTLGAVKSDDYFTPAEAGIKDGENVSYVLLDGSDIEEGEGTYSTTGPTLTRDVVTISKVAGVAGTSFLNLSGSATVFFTESAKDISTEKWGGLLAARFIKY